MSIHVLSWAWQQDVGDAGAKLVLLKLADQANDRGECWPSKRTMARDTEMSERTIIRKVQYLVERRLLEVETREVGGRQSSNLYRLPTPARGDNVTPLGRQAVTPGGDRAVSPESLEEPTALSRKESAHASIYKSLIEACFPAGATLTKRAKQQTALAATNIVSGGGIAEMVPAVKRAYLGHPSYSKCALTPMALSNRWSELAPVAMHVPCDKCNIAGGRHAVGCERIAA